MWLTIRLALGYALLRVKCFFGQHGQATRAVVNRWPASGKIEYFCSICGDTLKTFEW